MKTLDRKVAEFLNVPVDRLATVSEETLVLIRKAVEDEDFFRLHHLGYEVTMTPSEPEPEKIWFVSPPTEEVKWNREATFYDI